MAPKGAAQRLPVPWYRKKVVVKWGGLIFGFFFFGYLSLLVVYYSSVFSQYRPQLSTNAPTIDVNAFMSSFHPKFSPTTHVQGYYWPQESPVVEFSTFTALPLYISAYAISDWHNLYKWASGNAWTRGNTHQYDFQAQNSPVFTTIHKNKLFDAKVPLKQPETIYITLEDFFTIEFDNSEDDKGLPKYKKFEGIVRRPLDDLQEFPNAPEEAQYTGDLKSRLISLILTSHGVRQQPYLSLSGQLVMQVSGTTDWLLSPIEEAHKYELNSFYHPLSLQSQLDLHTKLNGTYLYSMNLEEGNLADELGNDIHVQWIRLNPGQVLYIPSFWVAQSLTVSSSVLIQVDLNLDIERRLEGFQTAEAMQQIKHYFNSISGTPEEISELQIHLLLRILDSFDTSSWYSSLFTSYSQLQSHIVLSKADLGHKLISSACALTFNDSLDEALQNMADSAITFISDTINDHFWKGPGQRSLVTGIVVDTLLVSIFDDPTIIAHVLQECRHHWQ